MSPVLSSLIEKEEERLSLLRVLSMWEKVEKQGINPEEVSSLSFSPHLMTPEEVRESKILSRQEGRKWNSSNPYCFPVVEGKAIPSLFNVVTLKSGERIRLSPMIERPN